MAKKWTDLDKHRSVECTCGNQMWSLKILEKTRDVITHIRIVCSKCGDDLPNHGEHRYSLCEEAIHFSQDSYE